MEENETRFVKFEVNNQCPGQPDLMVLVSYGRPGLSDWSHLCRVSKERKTQNCRCEESDAGLQCQFIDTFNRSKYRWRLSGIGNDKGRVEEKTFNVNVTCKYILLYYIVLYCSVAWRGVAWRDVT